MSDEPKDLGPVVLPEPEGTPKPEHGAQVRLTGIARAAARGAAHTTMAGNTLAKAAVQGGVADGGASLEQQRMLDPADGSEMEARIRERGEADRLPAGEDDEATAAKTAPPELADKVQTEATTGEEHT